MKVEIIETLSKIVEIDSNNNIDAVNIAKEAYETHQIVLDSSDFIDVDIRVYCESNDKGVE